MIRWKASNRIAAVPKFQKTDVENKGERKKVQLRPPWAHGEKMREIHSLAYAEYASAKRPLLNGGFMLIDETRASVATWRDHSRRGYSSKKGNKHEKLGKVTLALFFLPWS